MSLDKLKKDMLRAEKEYNNKKDKYYQSYWENEVEQGGVTVIENFEYARPLVTFNGGWDKENYICVDKPIKTEFISVGGVLYRAKLYSSRADKYDYELWNNSYIREI